MVISWAREPEAARPITVKRFQRMRMVNKILAQTVRQHGV
jgi:hypothetical protein